MSFSKATISSESMVSVFTAASSTMIGATACFFEDQCVFNHQQIIVLK